jgi:hypothetical protein
MCDDKTYSISNEQNVAVKNLIALRGQVCIRLCETAVYDIKSNLDRKRLLQIEVRMSADILK